MKIAYIFQIYKDFDYHAKVFRMLKEPWCDIFVHIDKKSKIDLKKYIKEYNLDDINFLKNRMSVYWGGFTQIQSTLKLFQAVKDSGEKYDRIIFITDNEFPCWSNKHIYEFFEQHKDEEFFSIAQKRPNMPKFEYPESRVNAYSFFDCPLFRKMPRRKLTNMMYNIWNFQRNVLGFSRKLLPYKYYRAHSKFYVTQDFIEYVLDYVKNNPDDLNTFKHTCCADEVFFVTLLMNNPKFSKNLHNNLYRFHIWGATAPIDLNIKHKEQIVAKNPIICAKITPNVSDELMEFLIERRNEDK